MIERSFDESPFVTAYLASLFCSEKIEAELRALFLNRLFRGGEQGREYLKRCDRQIDDGPVTRRAMHLVAADLATLNLLVTR